MGRRRRYHVLRLAREKQEQEALISNETPVKAPTTNLNTKPMVEPTIETKIDLKDQNEAPVELAKKEIVEKPKKTTRRRTTTTKKTTTRTSTTKKSSPTKTKSTTPRRRKTTKNVKETTNDQS